MSIKMRRLAGDNIIVITDRIYNGILEKGREEEHYLEIVKVVNQLKETAITIEDEKKLNLKLECLLNPDLNKKRAEINKKNDNIKEELEDFSVGENKDDAISKSIRIASLDNRFEHDGLGKTYLKGYSMPIAKELVNSILDATYNPNSPFTLESLISFWKWVILNPNPEARLDLFKWFSTGQFSITNDGLIIAYRCVDIKQQSTDIELNNFINTFYTKVKAWKKSPKNYVVCKDLDTVENKYVAYDIRKKHRPKYYEFVGNLEDLFQKINKDNSLSNIYTDNYSRTMTIKIGEEVSMPREECDENRHNSCSKGLHFMSVKYNLRLGSEKLVILVNPMNVVAFPSYDTTKGRCCAYMPIAKAITNNNGDIEEIDSGTYDFKYAQYTTDKLNELLKNNTIEELISMNLISSEIKEKDIQLSKNIVSSITKKRIIDVLK